MTLMVADHVAATKITRAEAEVIREEVIQERSQVVDGPGQESFFSTVSFKMWYVGYSICGSLGFSLTTGSANIERQDVHLLYISPDTYPNRIHSFYLHFTMRALEI